MIVGRMIRLVAGLAALGLAFAAPAQAQTYPDKPVKIIVPMAPGGPMDAMARLVAQKMTTGFGQPVIVENRPGAGGAIAAKSVFTADPDGYTLFWATSGTFGIMPIMNKGLDFDPMKFVPVALVGRLPHAFVIPADIPAKTVKEFVDYAKANPGKLNFGAPLGTTPHLMGAAFKTRSGVDITFIPYKGAAPSIADLLGGRTHMTFDALTVLTPLIKEGKLRALAIASTQRWPTMPDVPTMAEVGYPNFPGDSWGGIVAPPGTPDPIVSKLNAAINDALSSAEGKETLNRLSVFAALGTPQDFNTRIKTDAPVWAEMIKSVGSLD